MAKTLKLAQDEHTSEKSQKFIKNVNSDMHYKSSYSANGSNFDWLNEVEFALIYLDNIVRAPRVILVNEEEVVKVERAKKIVSEATGLNIEESTKILNETNFDVKLAIFMVLSNLDKNEAKAKLDEAKGYIAKALILANA